MINNVAQEGRGGEPWSKSWEIVETIFRFCFCFRFRFRFCFSFLSYMTSFICVSYFLKYPQKCGRLIWVVHSPTWFLFGNWIFLGSFLDDTSGNGFQRTINAINRPLRYRGGGVGETKRGVWGIRRETWSFMYGPHRDRGPTETGVSNKNVVSSWFNNKEHFHSSE